MKVKFKIRLTKLTNFFFFLANLSEWRVWNRHEYNQEWLRLTGKLSLEEEKTLNQFCQVLRDTSKKEPLLYTLFFQPDRKLIWPSAKKKLHPQDYNAVEKTFKVFQKRFDKIWDNSRAKKVKKDFKQYINNFEYSELILQDLGDFYSKALSKKVINIFLILLPIKIKTGGGRYDPKNQAIVLEGSPARLTSLKTVAIFFHELIHLYFEKPYFENLLNKYQINSSTKYHIKEVIAGSLLPNGYLSQKYFKKSLWRNQSQNLPLTQKLSLRLTPTVKKYFSYNKRIDKPLIQEVIKLYSPYQR